MKEKLNLYILEDGFQEEMIQLALKKTPIILDRYKKIKDIEIKTESEHFPEARNEVRNIIDNHFEGLDDCFELRIAKEKILPGEDDTYCHGTTAYLIGATAVSSLFKGPGKRRDFFNEALNKNDNNGELEVKIFKKDDDFDDFIHSVVIREGLIFERYSNGYDFKIIPIDEYSLNRGLCYIRHNSTQQFKTDFGSLYNTEVDFEMKGKIGSISG